ncbi:hypothetical protein T265_02977 [Opisthorchis viverrini]|uniref:Gpi16 subunit, GPI transamidase component n=1 Tax=Opisthorchis viverrini TaxID=6198 RepID=A0A075A4X5_OPIVI|nr:hypothetical protein T265_02977 [Opisthorchis viverrini]KER30625.1 hypothetical protein T265_02977 [Opisthorchis viverrini]
MFVISILLLCMVVLGDVLCHENFNEELLIKELGGGFTAFHFQFVSRTPEYEQPKQHRNIVPKSMFDILTKYSVEELHLSMVRGHWDDEHWGRNFMMTAPAGAELWSWFKHDTTNVDQAWFELTHALSGQFCASLARLSSRTFSVVPRWSFRPTGIVNPRDKRNGTDRVRYAQMPGEGLCSENFTPWVKLLPCKNLRGLATLLVPTSLFRSNYIDLSVNIRRTCWDASCSSLGYELTQTLTAVFDRRLLYGNLHSPWSIQGMLGSSIQGVCGPAESSQVFLLSSPMTTTIQVDTPSPDSYNITDLRVQAVYASSELLNGAKDKSLFTPPAQMRQPSASDLPLVSVSKYLIGSGTADGGIRALLTNRATFPLHVVYMDFIPWYTQVLFSTLKVEVRSKGTGKWMSSYPVKSHLVPSISRERMGHMELVLLIPPGHQVTVSYKFRRVLQRWDEYPPDANHGYLLPAAVVSYQLTPPDLDYVRRNTPAAARELALPNWASTYMQYFQESSSLSVHRPGDGFVRIYSSVVLITMPTPDFSMPFNALCIVCSVIALLFGSVHKVTAGQIEARPAEEGGPRLLRLLRKIVSRLRGLLRQGPPIRTSTVKEQKID